MLKEGDKAPAFRLPTDEGKEVSLKDCKGKQVVLYFYPKDMTPGCTQEACDFRDAGAAFKKGKTIVLGVSRDSVERHQKFREKYGLDFPLLSDEDGKVCKAYGVWKRKVALRTKIHGDRAHDFRHRARRPHRENFPKVKVNGHITAVLESVGNAKKK